ncbi:MAG: hypothetical protein A3K12_05900 [Candidatus Rokubacteria bacterium RIFCSPLOWO2_12_FULL_71_19]|nr:MAG: hypothetical protein A3K12_05900 [Candidatus Rokubacteria bacterium RIFCSPLOWO2_12_FULL_71_19]
MNPPSHTPGSKDARTLLDLRRIELLHPVVAEALRAKSGMERLRLAHEAWELARDRLTAFLAGTHPEWSPDRVRQEVARRLLRDPG